MVAGSSAEDGVRSLREPPYRPPRGLANAHVQSLLSSSVLRRPLVAHGARRLLESSSDVILNCGDGVRLLGHFSAAHGRRARGLAIFLHGWEGCASSMYVLSAAARLQARGLDVFRLNYRDHGASHHLNKELFHSCRIDEVVGAVRALQALYPERPTCLVGFSLGGNFALRVAIRAPDAGISLQQVVSFCPVLDPASTMRALETGSPIYRSYFLARWRRSLRIKQRCFPTRYDFGDLRRFPTIVATTDYFVREYTDFPDLHSYLQGYSLTGDTLRGLQVPSLAVLAADDPVIPVADRHRLVRSPCLDVWTASRGGHCGFLVDWQLNSWMDAVIEETVLRAVRPRGAPPADMRLPLAGRN